MADDHAHRQHEQAVGTSFSGVGSSLDPDDLSIPCAVFRLTIDEQTNEAVDAHYAYASREYCRAISRDAERIVGYSYLEIGEGDKSEWLEQCHRALTTGETVSGFWYDNLVRDWTCYSISPFAEPNCCVYTLIRVAVDDRQRKSLVSSADARTTLFISDMLSVLAAEQDYDAAMNGMLEMMSTIIHADRLSVFVCSGTETEAAFELCAEGVQPQLGIAFEAPREMLAYWFRNLFTDRVVLVPNTAVIQRASEPLYQWCLASGVKSLLAAPFFIDDEIVGFLGAYNYKIDETIDLNRLFEAVATFIAARIENRQLITSLSRAGTHDPLTDMLNRRGSKEAVERLIRTRPEGHYVLALFDLDDFKRVNDVWGHGAGDEALLSMTHTLRKAFPTNAILSRNGGDEFLAVLSGDAARNASTLLANLTQGGVDFDYEGEPHHITISIGYARYPEQATTMGDLLTKADAALYAVKLAGKAGFGKYTPEAEKHLRLQLGFSARDILDNVPYAMLVSRADPHGDLLFASNELTQLLGYTGLYDLMRSTGGTYAGIVHPGDRASVKDNLERRDETATRQPTDARERFAFRALTKEGDCLHMQAIARFVNIEEAGRVLYTLLEAV